MIPFLPQDSSGLGPVRQRHENMLDILQTHGLPLHVLRYRLSPFQFGWDCGF